MICYRLKPFSSYRILRADNGCFAGASKATAIKTVFPVKCCFKNIQGTLQLFHQGGAQTISHELLEKIGKENVWLQEPVTEINQVRKFTLVCKQYQTLLIIYSLGYLVVLEVIGLSGHEHN